jgi:hypothetical protein
MRCETCQGEGSVSIGRDGKIGPWWLPDAEKVVPCPDCGGCGIAHCCDGLVEVE